MSKIKYAGIVPLVGGMMFGAEKALGHKPEFILSYPAFLGNDKLLTDYWPEVPYHLIDDSTNELPADLILPEIDFVSALCPCAGLSQLNNGKKRGAEAPQNDWMYKSTEFILEKLKPKVLWGENAPGLYGPIGIPVAERLRVIGKKYGYSMSILRTSTLLHGVPQNRKRAFYFFWKSEKAPILNWVKKEKPEIADFLKGIEDRLDPAEKILRTQELQNDPLYIWMKREFGDWRAFMREKKGSMMDVMINSGKADEYISWIKEAYPDHVKRAEHALFKRSNGMGFWDSSPFLPTECTGALTGARMNAIHPTEDRIFMKQELMYFMGLPVDMKVPSNDEMGKMFQNVPSATVSDWVGEIVKFINGDLKKSEFEFFRQDNMAQRIEQPLKDKISSPLF